MSNSTIDDLLKRLQSIETDLEKEFQKRLQEKQKQFNYSIEQGKIRFEQGVKELQRRSKIGLLAYLAKARLGHLITAPIIYSLFIPFVILDFFVTIYQQICFRVYDIPRVKRSEYMLIDRQMLPYLNLIEKLNCLYCSYGNGLIEYVREVAARTEQYWCPIKHARRSPDPHRLEKEFVDFGDAENYRVKLKLLREKLSNLDEVAPIVTTELAESSVKKQSKEN